MSSLSKRSSSRRVSVSIASAFILMGTVVGFSFKLLKNTAVTGLAKTDSEIQRVLDLDAQHFRAIGTNLAAWNPENPEDIRTLVRLGKRYQSLAADIDLTSCPPSFRRAYEGHLTTWGTVIENLERSVTLQANHPAGDSDTLGAEVKRCIAPLDLSSAAVKESANAFGVFVRSS